MITVHCLQWELNKYAFHRYKISFNQHRNMIEYNWWNLNDCVNLILQNTSMYANWTCGLAVYWILTKDNSVSLYNSLWVSTGQKNSVVGICRCHHCWNWVVVLLTYIDSGDSQKNYHCTSWIVITIKEIFWKFFE